MSNLFDIGDIWNKKTEEEVDERSKGRQLKFEKMHLERIASIKNLCGRAPGPGEIFFLWTLNSFNAFTFITYIIKHYGRIEQLTFSTYSLNERILTSLIKWYDRGEIENILICISDSIKSRVPKVNDLLQAQALNRNITVGYAWNHSKVILMKTADHHFVVEGSGNFSENALNEQYIFINDESIYHFRNECIRGSINP